jgi:hypothetical protein
LKRFLVHFSDLDSIIQEKPPEWNGMEWNGMEWNEMEWSEV